MKSGLLAVLLLLSFPASAQQSSFQDSLLDCMVGHWILKGTIDGKETTHDVDVGWVLAHNYLQLHEVSWEKQSDGGAAYEAIVYVGWNSLLKQYDCLWLDVTGGDGLSNGIIGHAPRGKDSLAFLFTFSQGITFHTTFLYDRSTDTWRWLMDGEEKGKLQPFARVMLQRKS